RDRDDPRRRLSRAPGSRASSTGARALSRAPGSRASSTGARALFRGPGRRMSTAVIAPLDDLGFFGRLKAFADNIFEPKLHTAFAAFWSLSLLANLHVVSGEPFFRVDASLAVLVASVFTCLFFLRMVDEI